MAEQPVPDSTPPQTASPDPAPAPAAPADAAPADGAPAQPVAEAQASPTGAADPSTSAADAVASAGQPLAAAAQPAGDEQPLDQASIDALLKQANFDSPDAGATDAAGGPALEELLQQASFEDTGVPTELPGADASEFKLPGFQQAMADAQVSSIDLLRDVELNVKIELGRSRMLVEEVLQLTEGSVVELDKLAGDPVDVFVNDRLVAKGEVLVLNDNFCVRVNEIVPAAQEEAM